jgi:hypothetical protein
MCHGNDVNSIVVMPEDDLKRELLYAAGAVSRIYPQKPFGIGLNVRERDVDGDAKVPSGDGIALGIPIRRCLKLGCRFGVKANPHL